MAKTKIAWTHQYVDGKPIPGYTFNPWIGCAKVSEGCVNCYAERQFKRKPRWADCWGPHAQRRKTSEKNWNKPRAWNAQAQAEGIARRVFCASLADVFEKHPDVEEWRWELWDLIEETQALDWLLLTKRIENLSSCIPQSWVLRWPRNVWMGVTVETNDHLSRAIKIATVDAPVRFVSFEPLVGRIDFSHFTARHLDWFLIGAESGPNRRPMETSWVMSLLQRQRWGRPYMFVKQVHVDGKLSLDPEEWTPPLRRQEVPPPRFV